jgi:Protein of unknown function (DUF2716)
MFGMLGSLMPRTAWNAQWQDPFMSERFAEPPESAWTEIGRDEYDEVWTRFQDRFGFRASTTSDAWPAIDEPTPSVTFDLSLISDGPQRGAAYDAVNAEALRAFVSTVADDEELLALDWQHPAYRFSPSRQALTWRPEWEVPVYPDGDYFVFLTSDLSLGTFGHPWEQTLCVFGRPLVDSLATTLSTWLSVKRVNGTLAVA